MMKWMEGMDLNMGQSFSYRLGVPFPITGLYCWYMSL